MKHPFLPPALVAGLGLITATTHCLHAATFTVTTANISGPGSLPVAIAQANATPGRNQINVSVGGVITLGLLLPTITNSVAITGVASTPTVISGGGTLPLFTFAAGTTNSLSNLVLANGYTASGGAAVINSGALSVSGCVMTNNRAPIGYGGAVSNTGTMMIANTALQNNRATNGGALFSTGTMMITQCQVSQNQAGKGGAIYNTGELGLNSLSLSNNVATGIPTVSGGAFGGGIFNAGYLTVAESVFVTNTALSSGGNADGGALFIDAAGAGSITNSTFYQNAAIVGSGGTQWGSSGGAVYVSYGSCAFANCTIISNSSSGYAGQGNGGGIYSFIATVSLLNTVVAGNSASNSSPDLKGSFVSSGSNLIGDNQGATGLSLFDFQNVAANLGPLRDNGGSTPTCAPLPGSYAIGYGISTGAPTTDQRGVPRPQNGAFDIGAVQTVTTSPFLMKSTFLLGAGFLLDSIFDSTNKYRIQASTNLMTWFDLYTNTSSGVLHFADSTATNLNCRFYRAVKP